MGNVPRRGLYQGQWYADLDAVPDRNLDFQNSFSTPASKVDIDLSRLRERPESYHIFVASACPFAHRVLMMLGYLKGVNIGVTYCDPWLGHTQGWTFLPEEEPPVEAKFLWQIYTASDPKYSGRVTVPVLWDCDAGRIASAESLDIMRALAEAHAPHLLPKNQDFDHLCNWIHSSLNVGIYKVGFADSQDAYDQAISALDTTMNEVSELVSNGFAYGSDLTLADLLIFATAIRFDVAYHGAFQILHRRWQDDAALQSHLERIAAIDGIAMTVTPDDYRVHYFDEAGFPIRHPTANGHYIIPRSRDPLG